MSPSALNTFFDINSELLKSLKMIFQFKALQLGNNTHVLNKSIKTESGFNWK